MADRLPPALREIAERHLTGLAADTKFAAHVAKTEIERQIEAGELVPISRLQLGGGLELTPMGRVATLEAAIAAALELLDSDEADKLDALRAVLTEAREAKPAPAPAAKAKPADKAAPTGEAVSDDGRPPGMLTEGEEAECDWCQTAVDAQQANLSFTRFRTYLCKEHYQKHPSRGGKHAA